MGGSQPTREGQLSQLSTFATFCPKNTSFSKSQEYIFTVSTMLDSKMFWMYTQPLFCLKTLKSPRTPPSSCQRSVQLERKNLSPTPPGRVSPFARFLPLASLPPCLPHCLPACLPDCLPACLLLCLLLASLPPCLLASLPLADLLLQESILVELWNFQQFIPARTLQSTAVIDKKQRESI